MEMITGNGAPSKNLAGEVGQHYKDLNTGDIYECKVAKEHSPMHGKLTGGYIWKKIATGDHMEVCAGSSGGSVGGGWDCVIRYDGNDQYTWHKGDHTTLIDMLVNGQPPNVCIWYSNGDAERPFASVTPVSFIEISSGSGTSLSLYYEESVRTIDIVTGEIY